MPYLQYNGINNYSYCPAYDYTGVNGFTLGCWCYSNGFSGPIASVFKDPGNRVWRLDAGYGNPLIAVSANGTTEVDATSPVTVASNTWFFIAARYNPGIELALWVNGTKTVNTTSIPALLFVTTVPYFVIGSESTFSTLLEMRISSFFFSRGVLNDVYLTSLYLTGKALFGV